MSCQVKIVAAAVLVLAWGSAQAQVKPPSRNLLATPHNLSVSGGGGDHDIRSNRESRVCIFCHTPHHAQPVAPLWSREPSELSIYIPYSSPTLKNSLPQPQGASRLCLSCHDGTIALGLLAGGLNLDPNLSTIPYDQNPAHNPNLGTDLSDDHPISFPYLPGMSPELRDPTSLPPEIRLSEGTFLECTACHDPHRNEFGNFLVIDSRVQKDAICTSCHQKSGWEDPDTVHRTGGTRYPSVATQVAENGCRNCHLPHTAGGKPYLLQEMAEEMNCLASCHRSYPFVDIWSQFTATAYSHPVAEYIGMHQANPLTGVEDLPVAAARKHVECVDCHNPHRTGGQGLPLGSPTPQVPPATTAPEISGALRGVRGVDKTGSLAVAEAINEYEVCFKCHAGAAADQFTTFVTRPTRQFESYDESQRFYLGNPSYHPVTEDRPGNGQSLRPEYQAGMMRIYCVDCHSPHGSNEPHMLLAINANTYPSSAADYPLCLRCHDRDYLMEPGNMASSPAAHLHRSHIQGKNIPCSVCHDPHGVPASRGGTVVNGAHLINFDTRYAGASPVYDSFGRSCSVTCHNVNPKTY